MYRLMKPEKFTLDHVVSGFMSSYRQIQVSQFQQFSAAMTACGAANDKTGSRRYVPDESGKEYCGGTWIDWPGCVRRRPTAVTRISNIFPSTSFASIVHGIKSLLHGPQRSGTRSAPRFAGGDFSLKLGS